MGVDVWRLRPRVGAARVRADEATGVGGERVPGPGVEPVVEGTPPGAQPAVSAARTAPDTGAARAVLGVPPAGDARRGVAEPPHSPVADTAPGQVEAPFELTLCCITAGNFLIVADVASGNESDARFLRDVARAARGDWSGGVEQAEFHWPQSRIDVSREGAGRAMAAMFDKYRARGVTRLLALADEPAVIESACPPALELRAYPAVAAVRRSVSEKRRLWRQIATSRG